MGSIKRLRNVFVFSVITLALLELVSRAYFHWVIDYNIEMSRYTALAKEVSDNPLIGHVHKPGFQGTLMGVDVRINADGLRDQESEIAKGDAVRLVFLGDSLTFGWGVEQDSVFSTLIEENYRSRGKPLEILNFGTGNYNTVQEVNLFLDKGLKYKPDGVILFYFINDAEPLTPPSKWAFLAHSRFLTFAWATIRQLVGPGASYKDYYASLYQEESIGWRNSKDALLKLKEICDAKGISLNVVILPELHVLTENPLQAQQKLVGDFLSNNGIPFRDFFELFSGESDARRFWVAPDDAHPNALAHQKIAEGLSSLVESMYSKARGNAVTAETSTLQRQDDGSAVDDEQ